MKNHKKLVMAVIAVIGLGSILDMYPRGGGGGGRGGGGGGRGGGGMRGGGMRGGGGRAGGGMRSGGMRSGGMRSSGMRSGARSSGVRSAGARSGARPTGTRSAGRSGSRPASGSGTRAASGSRGQGNRGQSNRGQGNRGNRGNRGGNRNRNVNNHVNNFYGGGRGYYGGLGVGWGALGFGLLLSAPYWGWGKPGWAEWPAPTSTTVVVQSDAVVDNPQYGPVECWNDNINGVPVRRCWVPNEGYFVWDDSQNQYWNNNNQWQSTPYIYPAVGTVDDYNREDEQQEQGNYIEQIKSSSRKQPYLYDSKNVQRNDDYSSGSKIAVEVAD